ncbi:helix-turn-helix domain-containing protein [Candidatus Woesearchaeota archaeon]|nr:helix-turn-helix domain-containing protein [Candidatus Woesearchaeota archaeon]
MWHLKASVKEKEGPFCKRTVEFDVEIFYYALNNYVENKRIFVTSVGLVQGDKKGVENFMTSLRKDKKTHYFEFNGNMFIFIYSEPIKSERAQAIKLAYNPKFIYTKPTFVDKKGYEHWEISCPDRKEFENVISLAHKWVAVEFELHHLKKQKFSTLRIISPLKKLTDKQQVALDLAIDNGYFGYPRKIKLEMLAKLMGVSISTYQFHLAKAEQKVFENRNK